MRGGQKRRPDPHTLCGRAVVRARARAFFFLLFSLLSTPHRHPVGRRPQAGLMQAHPHAGVGLQAVQLVLLDRVAAAAVQGDPPGRGRAGGERAGRERARRARLPPQAGAAPADGGGHGWWGTDIRTGLAIHAQQDDRVRRGRRQVRPGGVDARERGGGCRGGGGCNRARRPAACGARPPSSTFTTLAQACR